MERLAKRSWIADTEEVTLSLRRRSVTGERPELLSSVDDNGAGALFTAEIEVAEMELHKEPTALPQLEFVAAWSRRSFTETGFLGGNGI